LAKGKTVIKNAHTRPEVIDLIRFLNSMGAKIKVFGAGLIEVIGVDKLRGVEYRIINDNVEALTYIIAAAITGGMIQIQNCPLRDMEIPLIYLRASGLKFAIENGSLIVKGGNRYTPIDLSTGSYPGVNSDYQPLFTVFASQAEGISHITDIRFRDRFQYLYQLRKQSETITITGPVKLQGTSVKAVDLRAGAALIVAALCAAGKTKIYNVDQIDRGYENIEIKLANLGGSIKRKGGN
jgi:UDP-N-acetylglucosamine 1-carboxyvinyltransferase